MGRRVRGWGPPIRDSVLAVLFVSVSSPCVAQISFERAYGGVDYDRGYSVQQTSDGGYIIAGMGDWEGTHGRPTYLYLVKTDSLGDTLWTRETTSLWRSAGEVKQMLRAVFREL